MNNYYTSVKQWDKIWGCGLNNVNPNWPDTVTYKTEPFHISTTLPTHLLPLELESYPGSFLPISSTVSYKILRICIGQLGMRWDEEADWLKHKHLW